MNFLFISELLPIDTFASEVVFYRHFKMLIENGHKIHLLTDQNSYLSRKKDLLPQFHLHILPNRKWYYLPFKPYGLLQKLRFLNYYQFYVKSIIKDHKIDHLMGFIHGNFLIAFAAYIQRKTNLQLFSFFHDDTNELNFDAHTKSINKNTSNILAVSKKVFIASNAFKKNWPNYAHKFVLLYPIPTIANKSKSNYLHESYRTIGYSGSVYNEIINSLDQFSSFLENLNYKLIIIGNNSKVNFLEEKYDKVKCLPLFDTAEQSNDFILKNCTICLIAYPENVVEMPWIKTCFPSKFIQYCILGIPTIIIAPKNSALGAWCIENNWILYSDKYSYSTIEYLVQKRIKDQRVIDQVNYFKTKIFDPKIIHHQLEENLFS